MLTLGVHDGHTATACLWEDGEVIACISEERLNREKEWNGFPSASIEKCLEITHKKYEDIDAIGVCSLMPQIGSHSYFNPHVHKRLFSYVVKALPKNYFQDSKLVNTAQKFSDFMFRSRRSNIINQFRQMGLSTEKIFFLEHHRLHAATAYYGNWFKNKETLVITLDGSGDSVCATVNIGSNGMINRIAQVFNYNSICDFYTRITQFLGMKPMSHEYKVMGMAPYAPEKERRAVLELIQKYFKVSDKDPLRFINDSKMYKWQFMKEFKRKLVGKRFDWIAGAIQDLFEDVMIEWIKNAIRISGVKHLALSGGGFMNVKLNYLISKLPEVESLFIYPSCGDDSNPIGAAILSAIKNGFPTEKIKPLGMVYWGPDYGRAEIEDAIKNGLSSSGFKIAEYDNINQVVAERLVEGKIVGRFTGRMEWGARALGNRSIVADPRNSNIIHKINKAIKMRDFWMPFAPAILQEYRNEYLYLRDDYKCPFMTIAADTKKRAWEDIPAGLHPFDKSSRAQILDSENHASFYELVSLFEQKTKVGGVLNTSFNLHGDAIVCSPKDAIYTFLNSDLDVLQLENFLIEK